MQRGILETESGKIAVEIRSERRKNGDHAMELSSNSAALARVVLDKNGLVKYSEGSEFLPREFVDKFVVRDFRSALGFAPSNGAEILSENSAKKIVSENYSAKFDDYRNVDENTAVPFKAEFRSPRHFLSLKTVKIFK